MYYLFDSGKTKLVGRVIRALPENQVIFKVQRMLFDPNRSSDQAYMRWTHTQPSPGDEIEIPASMLRPCAFNTFWIRGTEAPRETFQSVLGLLLIFAAFAFVCWFAHLPEPRDAANDAVIDARIRENDDAVALKRDKQRIAYKILSRKAWRKWSFYYYQTGRNDNDLLNDIYIYRHPRTK